VDKETIDMLASLGMSDLPGVVKQADPPVGGGFRAGGFQAGGGGFQAGGAPGRRL
ncbi:hypothetical protein KI387_025051, partial [Taxus chinensis]